MEENKKYVCDVCGDGFEKAIALAGHKRSHSAQKENKKKFDYEIKIFHQEGEPDSVQVAIHGKDTSNQSWQIKRGEWVPVPNEVISVLSDTVVETEDYISDDRIPGKYERIPRQEARYHFQVRPYKGE